MNCEKIQGWLAEYRSDALSRGVRNRVEAHLAKCEECRRELEALDSVLELVESNVPDHEPPVDLWNGVYNRIISPEARPSGWTRARHWFGTPAHAVGSGLALAALVMGLVIGTLEHGTDPGTVRIAPDNRYLQAHAYSAGHAPLADRVSYISLVAAAAEEEARRQ